ncbi:MAG: YbhB/YbcL family Raf kinase inhibitor-like protein [Gemmatimonadetes bacterium]|uniref:YbhB/YbcL family Raf kinase inhibitor-like protein n=1 Tax=Candidatus Kutchimonas denitrificans TaxID=3056748 RepID=A0AAE5CDU9_9BACT|nr:YbhB/YbcL family Raf kinase inhibitor-like protein [Gemmatimonadota bacterium]NIR76559.1 YbhB/YbcL family Raf kinase inhibitor-like protein [Candidatus Kutchimonas denitrificans]NIS01115.1 YbhB/YbcL family Raf kinase inhibitor-like protein [Gemmatimonadota bacterium]NIT66882.1 YbhB/YbcL family Raf kinase inhibitor-like protein [Gemmatimonadota bacterium]NIU54655.1 YbhB/YbcL family Raf kinase inhibitor-like protein [Gemmatimonadota bacterium]
MSIRIKSDAFGPGERIPTKYSQDGENVSPALQFENVPSDAQALALIVDDPDAPTPEPYVHWVMYGIPGDVQGLPEGVTVGPKPDQPAGALQGTNSAGNVGYDGPAPPKGHGTHHYHFKVYALGSEVDLPAEADKDTVLEAIKDRILDEGELVGTYER